MKINTALTIILVFFTFVTAHASAVETGGYIVQPAYDISPDYSSFYFEPAEEESALLDKPGPRQIKYSDLPLIVIVILSVIGLISFIAYSINFLVLGKIPFIHGLSKLKKTNLLENESRRKIYEIILQNPGIQLCEIEKMTGLTNKNVEYHIKKLHNYGMIVYKQTSRGKGYFQNSNTYSMKEKIVYMHSKNPTEKRIIEIIHDNPGITRKELSGVINISAPSVSWYISGLINDKIIKKERVGTRVHYYISDNLKNDIVNLITAEKAAAFTYEIHS
jgi:predicted transcriptional regulator